MLAILPQMSAGRQVCIDGFLVPRIEVAEDPTNGHWRVTYDKRFAAVAETLEELQRWLWIVANAQAVGEGYSCHGEHSIYHPNPNKVRVGMISTVEIKDTRGD